MAMGPSLAIIDDFLANPDDMRRRALGLGYDAAAKAAGANFPGTTSTKAFAIPGLDAAISRIAGRPLTGAAGTLHGHCRLTLRTDRGASGVHVDPAAFSGILYLTPPEHCRGGTDFYRHRRTGLDRVPASIDGVIAAGYATGDDLVNDVINRDTRRPAASQ